LRVRGWLTTIVLNLCRTRGVRRAARGAPAISIDDASPSVEPTAPRSQAPSEVAERRAERERWGARLAELPAVYRAAVVLRHVDGLSYPEAAAALGKPEGTVKAQVHRGIALLRTMLEADARQEPEEMTA
jgi:RNA polymerase sigma-70 factor (ECF subfamily)